MSEGEQMSFHIRQYQQRGALQTGLTKGIRNTSTWAKSDAGGRGTVLDDKDSTCRNLAYSLNGTANTVKY